jgi:hypothetical protein
MVEINLQYGNVLDSLKEYDAKNLEKAFTRLQEMEKDGYKLRANSIQNIKELQAENKKAAELLLYSSDLLQDITGSALIMAEESYHYVLNLHHEPEKSFLRMTEELHYKMDDFVNAVLAALRNNDFEDFDSIKILRDDIREFINQQLEKRLSLIRQEKPGTRQAILETNILLQSRDMLAVTLRVTKMFRKYG